MSRERTIMIGLLLLQIIAIVIYPLSFFSESPQSKVLPPSLFLLIVLTLLGVNTGVLTPKTGQVSLVFVQGINILVRVIMLLPNMQSDEGRWNWSFVVLMLIGSALSWFAITQVEKLPPRSLLLRKQEAD